MNYGFIQENNEEYDEYLIVLYIDSQDPASDIKRSLLNEKWQAQPFELQATLENTTFMNFLEFARFIAFRDD